MEDIKVKERYKNKYRTIEDDVFRVDPPFPSKNMVMEVTDRCNYDCIFCYQHKMTPVKRDIEPQLAFRIIEEAFDLGVREIGFSKSGEPFLCQELNQYISKAAEIGYEYIYLTTNGFLAIPDRLISAVESGLNSIKFSINAVNEWDYEFIHGVRGGTLERVMENLKAAYEYRKSSGRQFKIFVSYVETKYTKKDREEIYNLFKPYCDEVLIVAAWNLGGYNPEVREELSTPEMDVDYDSSRHVPCPVPFNAVTITADGFLSGCCIECQNYLAVEDLHEMSLADAWQSPRFQAYRRRHIDMNIKGLACENCIYNAKIKPVPLNDMLYSDFDSEEMFSGNQVRQRINNYLQCRV